MIDRFGKLLALAALLALPTGCGGDIYAGGFGEVEGRATSDGPSQSQSTQRSTADREGSAPARLVVAGAEPLQGTLQFTASISVLDQSGAALPIATNVAHSVRLSGGDTVALGRQNLPAARYPRARVTFTRVVASVETPLVIGGLVGEVTVQIPQGQPLVVEAPVDLLVRTNGRHALVVDLNAAAWLPRAVGGVVAGAEFQKEVELRAHDR